MPFDPHTTTLDELVQATLHVAEERYSMLSSLHGWRVLAEARGWAATTPAQWLAWIEYEAQLQEDAVGHALAHGRADIARMRRQRAQDCRQVAAALRHFGVEPAPLPGAAREAVALPPVAPAVLSQEEYVSGEGGCPEGHYRSAGCFCPACGEYHSCTTHLPEQSTDDGLYFFPMTCDTCGATWFDVLRLVGYSGLHNENGQKIPEKGDAWAP